MEPWKRPICTPRLPLAWRGFNGATAMEPWKRWKGKSRARPSTSFNGATAMEPWKRLRAEQDLRVDDHASMGPRRWSRGRAGSRVTPSTVHVGFNGATAMEPWKRGYADG